MKTAIEKKKGLFDFSDLYVPSGEQLITAEGATVQNNRRSGDAWRRSPAYGETVDRIMEVFKEAGRGAAMSADQVFSLYEARYPGHKTLRQVYFGMHSLAAKKKAEIKRVRRGIYELV